MTPSTQPPRSVLVTVRLAPMALMLGYVGVRALWREPRLGEPRWGAARSAEPPRATWTPMPGPPKGEA